MIKILAVGVLKSSEEERLCFEYLKRFSLPPHVYELCLKKNRTPEQQSLAMKALLKPSDTPIALDERGDTWTTENLSAFLAQQENQGKCPTFLIGGPDGFTPEFRKSISHCVCLGRMTLPHALVRVILLEQLYRCQQMKFNHPYHRTSHVE